MSAKEKFLAALLALAVPASGLAQGAEPVERPRRGNDERRTITRALPEGFAPSSFWIGAMCLPVDPALRSQLNLKDDEGLVVGDVMHDSPADKAGLKRYDVVTAIDGKPVKSLHELMEAVRKAEGEEMKLDVIRGGKRETVAVTPAKRPEADTLAFRALPGQGANPADIDQSRLHVERLQKQLEELRERLPEPEVKRMEQWIEQLRRGEHQPLRMQMFGPGVIMRQFQAPALPPGVSVKIESKNDEPTKIHVQRGDEKWDVTEKELDKLPEELRGPIGGLLVRPGPVMIGGPGGAAAAAIAGGTGGQGDVQVEIRTDPADPQKIVIGAQQEVEQAQRRMNDEMNRLRKQVEELQKKVEELNKLKKTLEQLPQRRAAGQEA